jgi:hypothetical protein
LTIDPRLDPDRCQVGRLSNEAFAAAIAKALAEFYEEERRGEAIGDRRRHKRGRPAPEDFTLPDPDAIEGRW